MTVTHKWILGVLIFLWLFSGFQIINGTDQLGFQQTNLKMLRFEQEQGHGRLEVIRDVQNDIDFLETFVLLNKALSFVVFPTISVMWMIRAKAKQNKKRQVRYPDSN